MWAAMDPDCGPITVPSPKLKVKLLMPIGSVEPEASAVTTSGVGPIAGEACSLATGAPTVTTADVADVYPAESVKFTATTYVPPALYEWIATAPGCGPILVPSPKSNV